MRRGLRLLLIAGAAVVAVAVLAAGYFLLPDTNAERLSRRDMMLGVLTLGVLSMAAFGFDLRDWF
ncbi:MAG TPA: hypothetical protein VFH78_02730 [Candidatus Thermoplasmatota archaeon]|nr:hypothetical protein [Candidatus Thermoplasmatota archaeon]